MTTCFCFKEALSLSWTTLSTCYFSKKTLSTILEEWHCFYFDKM